MIAKLHHFEFLLGTTLAIDLSLGVEEGLLFNKGTCRRVSFGCYLIGRLEYVILLAWLAYVKETRSIISRLEDARLGREHASNDLSFLLLATHEGWCFRLPL